MLSASCAYPPFAAPGRGTSRDLARQMADTRTMLTASWSLQRADHGEQRDAGDRRVEGAFGRVRENSTRPARFSLGISRHAVSIVAQLRMRVGAAGQDRRTGCLAGRLPTARAADRSG